MKVRLVRIERMIDGSEMGFQHDAPPERTGMAQAFANELGITKLKITHGLEKETAEMGKLSSQGVEDAGTGPIGRKARWSVQRKAGAKVRLRGVKLGEDDDRRPNQIRSARGP